MASLVPRLFLVGRVRKGRGRKGLVNNSRGPPRRVSAYEISKSTGFQVDFGFQNGFLDFKVDFWISKWISGFQSGFLDFKVDFWISSEFLDFI